jgi:hypothetical protein
MVEPGKVYSVGEGVAEPQPDSRTMAGARRQSALAI